MSIQIISNFNPTAKVCAVSDDDHIECLIEGGMRDNMNIMKHLIAHTIYDAGIKFKDDEEFTSGLNIEATEEITVKDAIILKLWKHLQDDVNRELCKLKIKDELGLPEELEGLPDALASSITDTLIDHAMKEFERRKEDENE